jgi:hypothetical protein
MRAAFVNGSKQLMSRKVMLNKRSKELDAISRIYMPAGVFICKE